MSIHAKQWLLFLLCIAIGALMACFTIATAQDTSRTTGWIVLRAGEYSALRASAYPVEPAPEPPPIEATLTKINYDLKIQGELAVGQAVITVDVIKPGWVSIPIPSTLLVRDAKLDGKPVSLVSGERGTGSKSAVFSYQGRAEIKLDIVLPVTASAANESLSLPPAQAGITRASILLPRQGMDMKLTGGFLSEKSESASESRWIGYGHGTNPLIFAWWKKAEEHRNTQPLRMRGSLTELIGLGEDNTSVQAEINVEVLQGAAHQIKIELPDKVAINQVSGAMVSDWEMKPGELSVIFLEPVEKAAKFVISGETRTPRDGSIALPLLRLLNAERETGGVAVEVLGAGEITDRKSTGLESADATDLGDLVTARQSPSLIAFRFRSGEAKGARSLAVKVARYTQESVLMANIEEARYQVLMSEEGKTLVQASYAIRNNRKNFLKIALPKDATIWSATLSGKPIRPGQAADGALLLPLEKGRAGEEAPVFSAAILYFIRGSKWEENGSVKLMLPALDLPVSKTGLQYFYPPLFKVTTLPGPYRLQPYQEPASYVLQTHGSGSGMGGGIATRSNMVPIEAENVATLPLIGNDAMDLINVMGGVVKAENSAASTQTLVGQFQAKSQDGKRAGILPISMAFPAFGPSIYLVSELTAENQSPAIDISYEADRKGGAR